MFWDPSTCESNDLHVLGPPTCRYTSLDRGCTQEKSEEMPVQLARLVLLATKKKVSHRIHETVTVIFTYI